MTVASELPEELPLDPLVDPDDPDELDDSRAPLLPGNLEDGNQDQEASPSVTEVENASDPLVDGGLNN